jgi:ATP-dependent DNA ligase
MTAVNVALLPKGDQWLYEVKLDGYRALLLKHGGHIQIRSRNANDLTATYPSVAATALKVNAESAVPDGEIVALDAQAVRRFRRFSTAPPAPTPSSTTRSTSCISTART